MVKLVLEDSNSNEVNATVSNEEKTEATLENGAVLILNHRVGRNESGRDEWLDPATGERFISQTNLGSIFGYL